MVVVDWRYATTPASGKFQNIAIGIRTDLTAAAGSFLEWAADVIWRSPAASISCNARMGFGAALPVICARAAWSPASYRG